MIVLHRKHNVYSSNKDSFVRVCVISGVMYVNTF